MNKGHVRHRLGLTQHQMAQYLSISYSLLAMYENGLRSLPLVALQKLAELELFLQNPPAQKAADPIQVQQREASKKALLKRRHLHLEYRKVTAQRQLALSQKKYREKTLLLGFLDHLKTTGKGNHPQTAWRNMMALLATEVVEEHGPHKQELLEIEIVGLQMQADLIKKML